jgi:hypothetical protein
MTGFLVGHATHPDWRAALTLAALQVDARLPAHAASAAGPLTLGFVYFTDHYAAHAQALLAALRSAGRAGLGRQRGRGRGRQRRGIHRRAGLVLMLATLPHGQLRGLLRRAPLSRIERLCSALVHADPATPDLAELVAEMSDRTARATCSAAWPRRARVRCTWPTACGRAACQAWPSRGRGAGVARHAGLPAGGAHAHHHRLRTQRGHRAGRPARAGLPAGDLGIKTWVTRAGGATLRATLVGLVDATHDSRRWRAPGQFGTDVRCAT